MNAGQQLFQRGSAETAVDAFTRAVAIAPERVEGWVNLGSALLESRQYEAAVSALQNAISLNSNIMIPHMLLGDALRLLGSTAASLQSYKRAVALQRAPMALNKLACALRSRSRLEEAEELYYEAVRKDPKFTLPRVNLATMQIERQAFAEARRQLTQLKDQSLPPDEKQEVASALDSIDEHSRLDEAINVMVERGDLAPLQARLSGMQPDRLQADSAALLAVEAFATYARDTNAPGAMATLLLPDEWPLIEAMHMIPLIHSVEEYRSVRDSAAAIDKPAVDVRESLNMEPAIRAARDCRRDMADPVKAEVHLRHWHALACKGVEGFMPGHFKYTQNWSSRLPTLPRVKPGMCSGTFRYLIGELYNSLPPGLWRAAVVFLALYDLHFFADGNARIGMIWMNRELEWAGLMPVLFSKDLGFKGQLGEALVEVRKRGGNIEPLLAVLVRAQQYARDFCIEVAGQKRDIGSAQLLHIQ